MTIADLIIKMSLDGKGVTRGADQAIAQFRRIGKAASNFAAGFIGVSALTNLSRKTVDYAGKIHNLSKQFSISTDALQSFDYAASQSAASIEDVTNAITKLQRNMVEAMEGEGEGLDKRDAFARMGVSLDDLKSKRPEQIFMQIAESLNGVAVNAQITSDMMDTMGKSATKLLPAFESGFADVANSAKELGQVMEDSVVKELAAAGDQWDAAGNQLMVGFAPVISFMIRRFNDLRASIAYVSAALGSLSVDAGKQGVLKTAADLLFPTKSFGGNAATRAGEAGRKAAMAIYDQEIAIQNQRRATGEAIEVEEKVKEKKKRERKARIDQVSSVTDHQISTDSLTRQGLFRGPVEQLKAVADRQLNELKLVRSHMQKIRELAEQDT